MMFNIFKKKKEIKHIDVQPVGDSADQVIECVPNFSVGHDKAVMDHIAASVRNVEGVDLLSRSYDDDHNRLVLTFIGAPGPVFNAAYASIKKAVELIDINDHEGVHPFIGAADVVPFIPVKNIKIKECVDIAKKLGKKAGEELKLPVYLYGEAARNKTLKHLYNIRHGGIEHLRSAINTKEFHPDHGPKQLHPTAGAVAIGARDYLIAFNVMLETEELDIAKDIAKKVREKDGGLKGIRAIGVPIHTQGLTQVSINVTHYKQTSLRTLMDAVKKESESRGVKIRNSEIVGLVPKDATFDGMKQYMMLEDFDDGKIIETYL